MKLILVILLTAFSGIAQGASVSFGLNENNVDSLGNSIDYATVTISDNDTNNDIDFRVDLNTAFFEPGNNFGMQSFFFNSLATIVPRDVTATSNRNWAFMVDLGTAPNDGFQASEFGRFDVTYRGTGRTRQNPLAFTLSTAGDSLMSYALNNQDGFGFAAHIVGFEDVVGADSGWFATSAEALAPAADQQIPAVPVPAALWLFGTALIGFIGFSRRTTI